MKTTDEQLASIVNEMNILISAMRKYQAKALCIVPFLLGYPIFTLIIMSHELYATYMGVGENGILRSIMWLVSCILVLKIASEEYPDREMMDTQSKLIALRQRVESEMNNE